MLGRAVVGAWTGLAHAVGNAARGVGPDAPDVDPALRRDGIGLFLVGCAIVVGAEFWWGLPGAVGDAIHVGVANVIGTLSYLAPVLLALMAWRTLRHPDRNGPGGRQVVGWTAVMFGLLGLINIARGLPRPTNPSGCGRPAGSSATSPPACWPTCSPVYVAVPLLILLLLFGVLVVLGMPAAPDPRAGPRRPGPAAARATLVIEGEVLPELEFGVDEAYDTPVVGERDRRGGAAESLTGRSARDRGRIDDAVEPRICRER